MEKEQLRTENEGEVFFFNFVDETCVNVGKIIIFIIITIIAISTFVVGNGGGAVIAVVKTIEFFNSSPSSPSPSFKAASFAI